MLCTKRMLIFEYTGYIYNIPVSFLVCLHGFTKMVKIRNNLLMKIQTEALCRFQCTSESQGCTITSSF